MSYETIFSSSVHYSPCVARRVWPNHLKKTKNYIEDCLYDCQSVGNEESVDIKLELACLLSSKQKGKIVGLLKGKIIEIMKPAWKKRQIYKDCLFIHLVHYKNEL